MRDTGRRRTSTRGWLVLAELLRAYLRPYAWQFSVILILLIAQAVGNLYLPNLNADVIDNGVVVGNIGYIWRVGGIMLAIVIALGVVSVVTVYRASRLSMKVGANMRSTIYRRSLAFSTGEIDRFGISSLITRNINDVQQVQQFLQMALAQLVIAIFITIGAIIMAIREGHALSLLLVVALPVTALVIGVLMAVLLPLARSVQAKIDGINHVLREQITGVRVIRAFLQGPREQDRFRDANASITSTALRSARIFAIAMPILLAIANLSSVGVIWFGGRLVSEGSMPIGNMSAFLIYIVTILMYIVLAVDVIVQIPRAVASSERIDQVIKLRPAISDPPSPVSCREATGAVEFSHVACGYPGSELRVLSDLTFSLRPGQTNAIIGGTGSGKTTLISLIPRFLDTTAGTVLLNGVDVREQSTESLWATIGLVPQTAFLFAGTVASNLRFAMPEATDDELWRALDVAQASDFVSDMPGQLDARVDQGGTNLSGGQRQRLAIARAVVRRPRIYLLDDCFSALDTATDARLRAGLRAEAQDANLVIVAQRVSTIMDADQIIVLDAGRIAGIGTHRQLLSSCGTYREIVASQLTEEAAV